MLRIDDRYENERARRFCEAFITEKKRPKYIFGRTPWADSIAEQVDVDGFVDDFAGESVYRGKPVVSAEEVPDDALVVSVVIGRPLTAEKRLRRFAFDSLDYFSFFRYSGLAIRPVMFWEGFPEAIEKNRREYEWIYGLLADGVSRNQFYNLVNFRHSFDLWYMRGFEAIESRQYFEDFLHLKKEGECFVDIGGFDGETTEMFVRKCPGYTRVLFFEPESGNIEKARERLKKFERIEYFTKGLSDRKAFLNFDADGSSSKVCEEGNATIEVDRLDALVDERVTFMKMDIEGAESGAIAGAEGIIRRFHPKLAISVYHKADDFWKIPRQILAIRDDYRIYLRHYTEGIPETVMFFVPAE